MGIVVKCVRAEDYSDEAWAAISNEVNKNNKHVAT